ncbi:MAG: MoaD/ThiS family protein, partial [Gemmataceae bacterium]
MTLEVLLFAAARDLVGAHRVAVELAEGATVALLRWKLAKDYPSLAGLLPRCAIAVNQEYASEELAIPAQAEVAIVPPVSG